MLAVWAMAPVLRDGTVAIVKTANPKIKSGQSVKPAMVSSASIRSSITFVAVFS